MSNQSQAADPFSSARVGENSERIALILDKRGPDRTGGTAALQVESLEDGTIVFFGTHLPQLENGVWLEVSPAVARQLAEDILRRVK